MKSYSLETEEFKLNKECMVLRVVVTSFAFLLRCQESTEVNIRSMGRCLQ